MVPAHPTETADEDRVAIVIGGSRGAGRAVARSLGDRGYAVVIGYLHDPGHAEAGVDEILARGGAAVSIRADVTDELDVERLFGETIAAFGRVDVVVHAAPVALSEILAFLIAHPGVDQGVPLARGATERARLPVQAELEEVGMSTTDVNSTTSAPTPGVQRGEMRLEVVVLPVSDVDRARDFYVGLGWRLDADFTTPEGLRVVQVTPPGSQASVNFGTKVSASSPGSVQGLILSVYDLDETRAELIARGAEVSEVFHDEGGVFIHGGTEGRVAGPDPEGRSYGSWASFSDPDGNGWLLQEIKTRLPGR